MNLCIFFEGTGQGVAGCITNVTRMRDLEIKGKDPIDGVVFARKHADSGKIA